jgi:DNA-binding HxlR family transcriptional regulator
MESSEGNRKVPLNAHEIQHITSMLKAVAHAKRVEILNNLSMQPTDYATLLRRSKMSRTALANHLTILTEDRMIRRTSRGWYEITEDGDGLLQSIVDAYSKSQVRIELERARVAEQYSQRARKGKGDKKMKVIKKLQWQPRWVSHLGCIEGCLKYMKNTISTGWLYGGTGHAFVLNIAEDLCPSGPTAWRPLMLFQLAHNMGYEIKGVYAHKGQPDFPKLQEDAWDHVKTAIDNDIPCYGWEVGGIPEYYVVSGYDDVGYYYSGAVGTEIEGPRKWQDVGTSDIGVLEMYSVLETPTSEPEVVVKHALEKILHHTTNPDEWIFDGYTSGIPGYDVWIKAVKKGTAHSMGLAYNAVVWAECRKYGVEFLKEAKKRLSKEIRPLFETSIDHYEEVSKNLDRVTKLFPFAIGMLADPIGVSQKSKDGTEYLTAARNAEEKGLESLKHIVETLSS